MSFDRKVFWTRLSDADISTNMKYNKIYGPSWVSHLPANLHQDLFDGKSIILGSKIYQVCSDCHQVVHINKLFWGSIHVCD